MFTFRNVFSYRLLSVEVSASVRSDRLRESLKHSPVTHRGLQPYSSFARPAKMRPGLENDRPNDSQGLGGLSVCSHARRGLVHAKSVVAAVRGIARGVGAYFADQLPQTLFACGAKSRFRPRTITAGRRRNGNCFPFDSNCCWPVRGIIRSDSATDRGVA